MKPYCRNNSNFTFREICCGPPIHDDCGCRHKDCCCGHNNHRDCCNKNNHKNDHPCKNDLLELCKNRQSCKNAYICLPIKNAPKCECNPFTFVMIGYMIGKKCNNINDVPCEFNDYISFDD